ncbi:hypothetical protein [Comamonas sp. lk]|uniref:phage head spike fiber domain-containing protein n=1 Tax=Comamonas sp. lk TaxID=2201272 RepID=UPI000EB10050|nr:hypothetical protein [Comamonas sp. lk]
MTVIADLPDIRPSLLLDFANSGRVDPRIQCVRASTATCIGRDGKLRTVAANVPRIEYNPISGKCLGLLREDARTNVIRNNTMVGAITGVPGTLPTNWSVSTPINGLSREIVGLGIEDGIEYIDIRWSGTATAGSTGMAVAQFEPNTGIAATSAKTWTLGANIRLVGGSLTGINSVLLRCTMRDVGNTQLGAISSSNLAVTNVPLALQRYSAALTPTDAATAFLVPFVVIGYSVGAVIDITLRIGLPQMELGASASSVIRTSTAAVTRAADVIYVAYENSKPEGTLLIEAVANSAATAGFVARLQGSAESYIGAAYVNAIGPQLSSYVRAAGDASYAGAVSSGPNLSFGARIKSGVSWGAGVFRCSVNGGISVDTPPVSVFPQTSMLQLCATLGGNPAISATIARAVIFPAALTPAQLQRLTTL